MKIDQKNFRLRIGKKFHLGKRTTDLRPLYKVREALQEGSP